MRTVISTIGLAVVLSAAPSQATDVVNRDQRDYTVTVQGEGKLGRSSHKVGAGQSAYGLCNYSWCTFAIPGHNASAKKAGRLTIRGGKFVQ